MAQFPSCIMNCLHFFSIWLCVHLLLLMLQKQRGDKVEEEYPVSYLCLLQMFPTAHLFFQHFLYCSRH